MRLLTPTQAVTLRGWFLPDRPGPLVGLHALYTGHGALWADRWPDPRAVLASTADNYALLGDPAALAPTDLAERIEGFLDAPAAFDPLLRAAFPELPVWDRVILALTGERWAVPTTGHAVRRLGPGDAYHLWGLTQESAWIAKTWGGPPGLAASGHAWSAFVDGQLASVACSFYVGATCEDLGVVTEQRFRGLGLSVACAAALCADIARRGRTPSWTTSPDNAASLRVAAKLGFSHQRQDRLFVIGVPIPPPAERESECVE